MTTDLSRLAKSLDLAAPDTRLAAQLLEEREKIEESLRTVGEYVLSDDSGRVYVITATGDDYSIAPAEEGSEAAAPNGSKTAKASAQSK